MAIVTSQFAPGAIASYADLLAAVRDEISDSAYPTAAIDRAIRLAEAYFNRELRTPEMEQQFTLTVTAELTTLPNDFLSLRSISEVANPSFVLKSMSPAALIYLYGEMAGTPHAYAIEGRSIRVAPVGTATFTLDYYAKIPLLTVDTPNNWLLLAHPDLYLRGVMYYLYIRDKDRTGMEESLQAMLGILQSIREAANRNRWGSGPLNPRGIRQVRGSRA
jgi:hypothetical protein